MKSFFAFALLIAGASASTFRFHDRRLFREEPVVLRAVERFEPLSVKKEIPILSLTNEIRGAQSNELKYETGNGISVSESTHSVPGVRSVYEDETGRMVESDSSLVKSGSYSYTAPDGTPISVTYTADENGFRVSGDHLPQPVELPAEHAEIHRQALARIGLVETTAPRRPLFVVDDVEDDGLSHIRIKSRHHTRPFLRFVDNDSSPFVIRSRSHVSQL